MLNPQARVRVFNRGTPERSVAESRPPTFQLLLGYDGCFDPAPALFLPVPDPVPREVARHVEEQEFEDGLRKPAQSRPPFPGIRDLHRKRGEGRRRPRPFSIHANLCISVCNPAHLLTATRNIIAAKACFGPRTRHIRSST